VLRLNQSILHPLGQTKNLKTCFKNI